MSKYGLEIGLAITAILSLGAFPLIASINTTPYSQETPKIYTVNIPADYAQNTTQEKLDESVSSGKLLSAKINEDGSITATLNESQRNKMLSELRTGMEESIRNLINNYENIDSIDHNDNYSQYTIYMKTNEVSLNEKAASLGLAILSGFYNYFNDSDMSGFKITYLSADGEVLAIDEGKDNQDNPPATAENSNDNTIVSNETTTGNADDSNENSNNTVISNETKNEEIPPRDSEDTENQEGSAPTNQKVIASFTIPVYDNYYGQSTIGPYSGYAIDPSTKKTTSNITTNDSLVIQEPPENIDQNIQQNSEISQTDETSTTDPSSSTTENSRSSSKSDLATTIKAKEGAVIYSDNDLRITYKGIDTDDIMYSVKVLVENIGPNDYTVQCRDSYINNYLVDPIFSTSVNSKRKANATIDIFYSSLENNDISNVKTFETQFSLIRESDPQTSSLTDPIILEF